MTFGVWQVVWLVLMVSSLMVNIAKHGEPSKPYNAGTAFIGFLLQFAIAYFGGFFK